MCNDICESNCIKKKELLNAQNYTMYNCITWEPARINFPWKAQMGWEGMESL